MTDANVTHRLARWIVGESTRERGDDELALATQSFIDTCGCAVAGSRHRGPTVVQDALGSPSGECSLIGDSRRAPAHSAALANGMAAHALDYDDYELVGRTHPSVVLVPTVLALAERRDVPGRIALGAYLAGFDVIQTIGWSLSPTDYLNGFHTTGTTGSLGATATACVMLGLDVATTEIALGIASSLAAGVRVNFGTDVKPLHAGQAASNGVLAANLAAGGISASAAALESDLGFAACHAPSERHRLTEHVERLWAGEVGIIRNPPTRKPYAACGGTHSAIGAALSLRSKAPSPEAIEQIVVDGAEQYAGILVHRRPTTGLEAKFSMEGALAITLVDGAAGITQFTDESLRRPAVQRLIPKVLVRWDRHYTDLWQRGDSLPAAVTLTSGDWSERSEVIDAPGSPRNPMTHDEMLAKFVECTTDTLGVANTEKVADQLARVGELSSIGGVAALLRPST